MSLDKKYADKSNKTRDKNCISRPFNGNANKLIPIAENNNGNIPDMQAGQIPVLNPSMNPKGVSLTFSLLVSLYLIIIRLKLIAIIIPMVKDSKAEPNSRCHFIVFK